MGATSVEVRNLEPFGAEVRGDLSEPGNLVVLADLLQRHGLLVLRDQELGLEEQRAVMATLGPVADDTLSTGYVSNVRPRGLFGDVELSFHQDYSQTTVPLLALSLHAVEIEGDVSATAFASGERAFASMPADLRDELLHRQVHNVWPSNDEMLNGRSPGGASIDRPGAVHAVLPVDPITGRHTVAASAMMTVGIVGVPPEESQRLLAALYDVLYADDNILLHQWQVGDLVIWSNLAAGHARDRQQGGRRTLQRVCLGLGTAADYTAPAGLGGYVHEAARIETGS